MPNKIRTKTFTEEEKSINKITANYVLVGKYRKFEDYFFNRSGIIVAINQQKNEKDFYNTIDVLNSIVKLGKSFHSIFKDYFIKNQDNIIPKNNDSQNDELTFVDLKQELENMKPKKLLSNYYVNHFIPDSVFSTHIKELEPLLLEFCQNNGMPYIDDKDYQQNDDGTLSTFYYCNAKPFVSLSIIIFILFETQEFIKQIIEYAYCLPTINDATLGYISVGMKTIILYHYI